MTGRLEFARRHGAPEYTHVIPNGFCLGAHSGRPERWSHDGTRWVAAEPSRYGFSVWGYDNDAPVVVRLGENLSGREVERVAELFLAEKRKNGTHLLIGTWADKTGQAFNTGRVAEKNNTECRF
jgi:hypothetical protein